MIGVYSHESLEYLAEVGVFVVKDCEGCDEDEHKIEEEGRKRKELFCLPLTTLAPGR